MKTKYQFIHFESLVDSVWICRNNRTNDILGSIDFCDAWKQWVFSPADFTQFSIGCLNDIVHFLSQIPKCCAKYQEVFPF